MHSCVKMSERQTYYSVLLLAWYIYLSPGRCVKTDFCELCLKIKNMLIRWNHMPLVFLCTQLQLVCRGESETNMEVVTMVMWKYALWHQIPFLWFQTQICLIKLTWAALKSKATWSSCLDAAVMMMMRLCLFLVSRYSSIDSCSSSLSLLQLKKKTGEVPIHLYTSSFYRTESILNLEIRFDWTLNYEMYVYVVYVLLINLFLCQEKALPSKDFIWVNV